MTGFKFIIRGNQKDPSGNPIPYKRTLRKTFSKEAQDYHEWKEYVRSELDRTALFTAPEDEFLGTRFRPMYSTESLPYPEICKPGDRVSVKAEIFWKNGHHGDGDNVLKGILDALFRDDKFVWEGHYRSFPSAEKVGCVLVTVQIEN